MFRRILIVILCLGLSLQAWAAHTPEQASCSMERTMQAMLESGDPQPADLPPCCNDLADYLATGQACKAGAECGSQSPTVALLPAASPRAALVHAHPPRPRTPSASTAPTLLPWRPPTST